MIDVSMHYRSFAPTAENAVLVLSLWYNKNKHGGFAC
jgi:hypothetical protein